MRPQLFLSAKTVRPIPVGHPLLNDALVIATLDAAVTAIGHVATVDVGGAMVPLDAIVVVGAGGKSRLDVAVPGPARDIDEEALLLLAAEKLGLPSVRMTAEEIAQEPRASNSRLVWACRHARISPTDRIRVLAALGEESPLPLLRAAEEVRNSADPVAGLFAMACLDLVEIDLVSGPLGPSTRVTGRDRK